MNSEARLGRRRPSSSSRTSAQGWSKALQSLPGAWAPAPAPARRAADCPVLAPDKLQALQQAYLEEAAELWNQGLRRQARRGDKRFAGEAWAQQPGRRLLRRGLPAQRAHPAGPGRSRRGRREDQGPPALRGRAVDGRLGAQQLPGAQRRGAEEGHRDARARASPRACRTCCTTCSRAMCRMTDESVFEVGRNVATTEGAVVFENELFQLHRIQAAHGQGVRAAVPAGAALHQQVLHPRPAARELADPLRWWSRAIAPSW